MTTPNAFELRDFSSDDDDLPAYWWESRLAEVPQATAARATGALTRLVTKRLTRGDLLSVLQDIQAASESQPASRAEVSAYIDRLRRLLEAVYEAWDEVERFARPSFADHLATLYEAANVEWDLLDESLKKPESRRDLALKVGLYELVAASVREHGAAKYADLCALLAAVGLEMNAQALRQLVSRESRRRGEQRKKKTKVRLVSRRPRGRPPKPGGPAVRRRREVLVADASKLDALMYRARGRRNAPKPRAD